LTGSFLALSCSTVGYSLALFKVLPCCLDILQAAYPGSAGAAAQGVSGQPTAVPVTVLLVDTAGPDEFLDLVRGGLALGLEALPPDSLMGLMGVSDCITLVDMAGEWARSKCDDCVSAVR
jgi:hypothetical protein